jgi:hypothetical protein
MTFPFQVPGFAQTGFGDFAAFARGTNRNLQCIVDHESIFYRRVGLGYLKICSPPMMPGKFSF